ncbi:hypothetical protein [Kangiella aquimarina]|uniref:Uncharacterized protein n=1 Tax=Kangiella aquimarina TaxID=261965 RepID=A0ABZ0X4F8_9GAMM|nr:hypothetical protein [Kangiella aquimarina]WQG85490.1 hypothetical protein SR900_01095 [Kangiella aquimarina]
MAWDYKNSIRNEQQEVVEISVKDKNEHKKYGGHKKARLFLVRLIE